MRPIEPLTSLMCKAQLLLKVSLHLLDNEIHLLNKNVYLLDIAKFLLGKAAANFFTNYAISIWLKVCLTYFSNNSTTYAIT